MGHEKLNRILYCRTSHNILNVFCKPSGRECSMHYYVCSFTNNTGKRLLFTIIYPRSQSVRSFDQEVLGSHNKPPHSSLTAHPLRGIKNDLLESLHLRKDVLRKDNHAG